MPERTVEDYDTQRRSLEHLIAMLKTAERHTEAAIQEARTVRIPLGATVGLVTDAADTLRSAIEVTNATIVALNAKATEEELGA